ncbi:MAG: HAD family hydrolase [Candidatus Eremiobacteraeota bacterium]|nr:HAD family hydrolase [Candidatus Eremiobacteraeota bacterium]MBC5827604.1 HAD family hydrolase [Candidatus Eremiobacteraeota bacterium]
MPERKETKRDRCSQASLAPCVLFDFDHTLGIDHQLEERALRALCVARCDDPVPDDFVLEALRSFRQGRRSLGAALSDLLARCGCTDADPRSLVAAYKSAALQDVARSVTPMPGAPAMLAALAAAGIKLAILTNGWTELQRAKAAAISFPGPVFVSQEIGAWKPDPRAFEIAAALASFDVGRTAYVGDSGVIDVAGAKAAGMFAVWADLEGKPYPAVAPAPDAAITSLGDLPELLRSGLLTSRAIA